MLILCKNFRYFCLFFALLTAGNSDVSAYLMLFRLSIQHFDQKQISPTTGQIATKLILDVDAPQKMIPTDFGDPP